MANCRCERLGLDTSLFLLLLLHPVQIVDDFVRFVVHVQRNCRHTHICLLFHSHRYKAIRKQFSQRFLCFIISIIGVNLRIRLRICILADAFDLVGTLLVWEIFFDGMLDDFLN